MVVKFGVKNFSTPNFTHRRSLLPLRDEQPQNHLTQVSETTCVFAALSLPVMTTIGYTGNTQ